MDPPLSHLAPRPRPPPPFVQDPMCTGVVATVAEARDPLMCTYTLEGSLAHQMMNEVKLLERKENGKFYDGLVYKMTAEEKKAKLDQEAEKKKAMGDKYLSHMGEFLTDEEVKATEEATAKAVEETRQRSLSELPDSIPFKEYLVRSSAA